MKKYDVIVIGSGGGAKITSPAAHRGLKVACVEKDALGGTCLNRGCIPSKMMIHPADVAMTIKEAGRFDIHLNPQFNVDFAKLVTRISNTVDMDSQSIAAGYERNPNIDFYHTTARFVSNKVISVGSEQLTADKIFIAVGARPYIPPVPGLEGTPFMTSTEALRNTKLPKSMIIIGGNYIAVELGHAYGALGTKTHFLVRSRLIRAEDAQVSEEFTRIFCQHHDVHLETLPTSVHYREGMFRVGFKSADGKESSLMAEALLVATGIVPNTDTLGLQNTGIQIDENGFVKVDNHLRTAVEGVYAMGDCIGRYFFRHSVNFEGEYLFRTVFEEPSPEPIRYPPMPHAIFTHPQVAGVGKTEDQLKAEGIEYVIGFNPYKSSAMGMALLSDHGFVKILFERKSRRILGAHVIGPEASDMIHMLIAFMNKNGTLDDLLNMIYIHPALPEIVRNAARKAKTIFDQDAKAAVHPAKV
jgi:mycothione reductase